MHRVNHINKKTGVTYVYESASYWDKEKKQARNKQVCIGKIDPVNGEFIPSKRLSSEQAAVKNTTVTASAQIIGPSMILDKITTQLSLDKILKSCFPETYQQILMMAYYLVIDGRALSHCATWCRSHAPLMEQSLTSQRISEILHTITLKEKQIFLTKWMKTILEEDYLCYDITSVSSYSEFNEYIKYYSNS